MVSQVFGTVDRLGRRWLLRLVSYRADGPTYQPGLLVGDIVVDAAAASGPGELSALLGLLAHGGEARTTLDRSARALAREAGPGTFDLGKVRLGAPVQQPQKFICAGANYADHAREAGLEPPKHPVLFAKFPNCLIGPHDDVVKPGISDEIDFEGEVAVVIGARCKNVRKEDAFGVVAGLMLLNDVTARDVQFWTSQWMIGKSLDTFAPCGPSLVSLDEIGDPREIAFRTMLNGEVVQTGNTQDLIFPIDELIAFITSLMTLEPGDILATGTPAGVGFTRTPPLFMRSGDLIEVEAEGLGRISNRLSTADVAPTASDAVASAAPTL
jgi:2-keto-4-pentenoate hydratase/2-oxohepta-3-ene-1,7-dioic acid hydratase in catechol pathway